jgi:MerR family transcriptional regulator, thiopeptide resistance regulator
MQYTVKQLAKMAGITNRTLHYYDEIGLLQPASYGDNGYRYYDEDAVLRLQQIMFYRELGFRLDQIKTIINRPDFDLLQAMQAHRKALLGEVDRLNSLVETVDNTMKHIRGEMEMSKKDFYKGFDEEKQRQHAKEAEKRWGEKAVQSQQRWEDRSPEGKNAFLTEMHEITANIAANVDKGVESVEVQQWVERWHRFIDENCYPCSLEIFEGLGHMYPQDPEFRATYENIRPGLAEFMEEAMSYYCQAAAGKQ